MFTYRVTHKGWYFRDDCTEFTLSVSLSFGFSATIKELSLCNKLGMSDSYIFATLCRRPQIFQTMNSVRSNNLSLKYQSFTTVGCKDIGIRKFEFVAKTQFLSVFLWQIIKNPI